VTIAIVGASAGLGRALAEECGRRRHNVVLVASDERDVKALAWHLRLMYGVTAEWVPFHVGSGDERMLAESIQSKMAIDGLFFPIGLSSEDDTGLLTVDMSKLLVDVNFLSQTALVTCLWPVLLNRPKAYIIGFGSVAAIRGRQRNVIYSASKRALSSYFESLRHIAVGTSVRVHFYQLGYLDTLQTYGKQLLFPKAKPADVAKFVMDRLDRDEPALTYPRFWTLVSAVLRWLPWPLFKRLQF
jgi:short-subunit dehydrogenase